MSKYSSQLRDPRWQKKRLEVLESHGWMCDQCVSESRELHVHHLLYIKGRNPWEYQEDQLAVLCNKCHEEIHACMEEAGSLIASASISFSPVTVVKMLLGHLKYLSDHKVCSKDDPHVIGSYRMMQIGWRTMTDCSQFESEITESRKMRAK